MNMDIFWKNKLYYIFLKLFGVGSSVNILKRLFVEALKTYFKLDGAFRCGIKNFYGFLIKNITGNFKMETDAFRNVLSVFVNDKSPYFFGTASACIKCSVNKFYCLGFAVCKKKDFFFCSFGIEKTKAAYT